MTNASKIPPAKETPNTISARITVGIIRTPIYVQIQTHTRESDKEMDNIKLFIMIFPLQFDIYILKPGTWAIQE